MTSTTVPKTCSEIGCDRSMRSNGLCATCYARHRRHGTLPSKTRNKGSLHSICAAEECDREVGHPGGKGYCSKHYQRLAKALNGLQQPTQTAGIEIRFFAKVLPSGACSCGCACELWNAGTQPDTGYGNFSVNNRTELAHRVAYTIYYGKIPEGLVVDHVFSAGCMHKHCVKKDHLEAVTYAENAKRGKMGRRAGKRLEEHKASVLEALTEGPKQARELVQSLEVSSSTAYTVFRKMAVSGEIHRYGGYYSLP